MYYEHDLTQQQIASRLNITRQKVSRLLIQGREEGIVTIIINDPASSNPDLESAMMEAFHLKNVILVEGVGLDQVGLRQNLGIAAGDYLTQVLKDGHQIGIGWGRTLRSVVSTLRKSQDLMINVFPLVGGVGDMSPSFQVNGLARIIAETFNGSYRPIYAPAFTQDINEWKTIMDTVEVKQVAKLWPELDLALVGIGHVEFQEKSSMFFSEYMTESTLEELKSEGGVGDICGNFYDIQGLPVMENMGIVGINLEQIQEIPEVIGVAGGLEKTRALLGALQGGFITTLVTDIITAREVLAEYTKEVVG